MKTAFYRVSILLFLCMMLTLALAACGQAAAVPTSTPAASATPAPTATPTPEPSPISEPALPPEPQEITIQTSDGRELQGRYYPAAQINAPVVVFIHWVPGDMNDWNEVAVWLQNRGQKNPFPNPGNMPFWDPSWFPAVPEGVSYAVLTFSLESCLPFDQRGCSEIIPDKWLLDIQAAMQRATELEGVDPTRIVAIGSSVGADGAPDGCAWLNKEKPGSCRGALSLSPGDYLDIPYSDVVKELSESEPPVPVWCLAGPSEFKDCEVGEHPGYQAFNIPDGEHGTMLLSPGLDPLPMQLILDFLMEATGE